jgi:predicted NUDIX family NTP pyrophosphohydrolase
MAARRTSAGVLAWRRRDGAIEVLLAHPGGPYWARKDHGAWTIPKGEVGDGEEPLAAAAREFEEETGVAIRGPFELLPPCRLRSGKTVHAWAVEADLAALRINMFTI